jgi:hypothetical protein
MAQSRESAIGCGFGLLVVLAVAAWLTAVLALSHFKMDYSEARTHRDAISEISSELNSQFSDSSGHVLVPRKDDGLDIFVSQPSFESVPYPDRDSFTSAIADIWCSQISSGLLPTVRFRDIRSGGTLAATWCDTASVPSVDGSYGGVVHNKTADEYAQFNVQMVAPENGIKGCMQVKLPLYGTGPIHGSVDNRNVNFILNGSGMTIQFKGRRSGRSIKGTYVVTTSAGQQLGDFTLHQNSTQLLSPNVVDIESCPSN